MSLWVIPINHVMKHFRFMLLKSTILIPTNETTSLQVPKSLVAQRVLNITVDLN